MAAGAALPYSDPTYAAQLARFRAANLQNSADAGVRQGTGAGSALTALRRAMPDMFEPDSASSFSSGFANIPPPRMEYVSGSVPFTISEGSPTLPNVNTPDSSAAEAAAFARAKDKIGLQTRGAIRGLQGELAGRGVLGSGVESSAIANVLNAGQGELGDVTREGAIQAAEREREQANLGYQGQLTQRSQNLSAMQHAQDLAAQQAGEAYRGAITQRGQDMAAAQSAYQMAQQSRQSQLDRILSALRGQVY